ncbi:hypothetical protein SUGI_0426990 [Cryptomeria japonica]|uniref:uncharacterized protein LOC131055091 n=1 Tax=Cryptomeria japonica TaxID=3369 RepID=UPI0024089CF5|nr:uncharacterized protein LOC131055091 [Cryptomeria japonica]GLJ22663.1 hypothetical protein SUGI_0426990 [Cryptomeria japonica]
MNYSENFRSRQVYLKHLLGALEGLKNSPTSNEDEVAGSNHNIKLAVDVSLALTANQAAWSRALLSRISSNEKNRAALKKIMGPKKFRAIIAQKLRYQAHLVLQSKLKRAHKHRRKTSVGVTRQNGLSLCKIFSSKRSDPVNPSHANFVKKLQKLVPGGELMDTSCLLRETALYITSLTTQVEVLQYLIDSVNNTQHPVCKNFSS